MCSTYIFAVTVWFDEPLAVALVHAAGHPGHLPLAVHQEAAHVVTLRLRLCVIIARWRGMLKDRQLLPS